MQRPLVIVAIWYVCGVLLAEAATPPLPQLLGLGWTLVLGAVFWERVRPWLLLALFLVAGWANHTAHIAALAPHDLRNQLTQEPAEVAVRGTLAETPSVRVFIRDEAESFRTLAVIDVSEVCQNGNWQPAHGQVLTTTPGRLDGKMFQGTPVEVRGVIAPPTAALAPELFDYQAYLARQGIYFQLKPTGEAAWILPVGATPRWADKFLTWAHHTLTRGLPYEDLPAQLLLAMTLGWKTGLTNEIYEPFMQSGTMHIFAISGLHIALIAALLVALLRGLQIPRQGCGLLVIPLIWCYTGATGWQSSAIRSTIMMTVIIGGWSLRRPTDLLNSLAVAGLAILVWEPTQLFQASFQLSFFVVLSIALLLPPLQKFGDRLIAHDPWLPGEALPRARRIQHTALRWLVTSFATSLAAWLGSLPLTIYYFHIFSPVTLLANLVIVPLSGAALACNLGSLLAGGWLPWVGELFNHSAWLCMTLMVEISRWTTTWPGAFNYVAAWPKWIFAAYYLVLLAALSGWLFRRENRRRALLLATVIIIGLGWEWRAAGRRTRLTVLPLSGGHAVHLATPAGHGLIDCGSTNAVEFVTRPFLRAQGVDTLANVALTHGDLLQMGGLQKLREAFAITTIYTSPLPFRSPTYRRIRRELQTEPNLLQSLARGQTAGVWQALHPAADDKFARGDDGSLVLRGDFHGVKVLLLGDLGRPGQEKLLSRGDDLRADIVVTGLPEEGEALREDLLAAIQPQLVIVADAEFPAPKRASAALKKRLRAHGWPVLYTRTAHATTVTIEPEGWVAQPMTGDAIRGARR